MSTLTQKKTIESIWPVVNKKFFIRVDFNVPISKKDGTVESDYRIRSAVPTIQWVLERGGTCVLASHLGRPEGGSMLQSGSSPRYEARYTLQPAAACLENLLNMKVIFATDVLTAKERIDAAPPGSVILLENCRFYKEENADTEEAHMRMAKILSTYADYFVSDAFGVVYRDGATITALPKVLGHGVSGFSLDRELRYFSKVLLQPARPFTAIVGGSKVSSKILLMRNMLCRIDRLVIGGAMAFTFLQAQGKDVANSKCETDTVVTGFDGKQTTILEVARQLLKEAVDQKVRVVLPEDHVCHTAFATTSTPVTTTDANVPRGYMALDIGPLTVQTIRRVVRSSSTVLWNGPVGAFETEPYHRGTFAIAQALGEDTATRGLLTIVGGGDTTSAVEKCGEAARLSHVSTGGGAALALLEGKELPGVTVLDDEDTNKTVVTDTPTATGLVGIIQALVLWIMCRLARFVGCPSPNAIQAGSFWNRQHRKTN